MLLVANPEINGEIDFDQFYDLMSTKYDQKYLKLLQDPQSEKRHSAHKEKFMKKK